MSWGTGAWGTSPWGGGGPVPAPTLSAVSPGVAEIRGGTVLTLTGIYFTSDMTIDVLLAAVVVGSCVVVDSRFDVRPSRAYVGAPALDAGTYDLRITTDGGTTTLSGALVYALHAEEYKVVKVRSRWPTTWDLGSRYLTSGGGG